MIQRGLPMVVAARRSQVPKGIRIPANITSRKCAGCDCELLVSPASVELLAAGEAQAVCDHCSLKTVGDGPVIIATTPAIEAEARQYRKDDAERN